MKTRTPAQEQAVTSTSPTILVVAGPGAGKTATTIDRIVHLIDSGVTPRSIVALTFTNAAAREMEQRLADARPFCDGQSGLPQPPPLGHCGTLHSFALRMLKQHGGKYGYGDRMSIISPESANDLLQSKAQALGCKMKLDDLLKLKAKGHKPAEGSRLTVPDTVIASYHQDLKDAGIVDFDILLTEFARLLEEPDFDGKLEHYTHLFVDEVQDSAPIDWEIYLTLPMPNKFYVGDPDQCQPAGTMVMMADGQTSRPIESLQVGDKVMTYGRHEKTFVKNGVVAAVSSRPYQGPIYAVQAGQRVTFCTPNHKWLIKWPSGKERTADSWCVYMMRKGDHFRIGKTRFFRGGEKTDMIIGLPLRMKQEKAASGWILKVHDTEAAATAYEQIVAANYGLPEACFVSNVSNRQFTQPVIDAIFAGIPRQLMKAERCLQDHGRELDYPLFDRRQPRTRRTVQEIQACNLISGIMKVPVAPEQYRHTNRSGTWTEAQIGRHHFSGLVYSLDVTPHHKYVANGIVTCNSIYAFRGGDLNGMMWLAKRETTEVIKLEQNFRSHEEICQAAQNLIEHNRERIEKQTVSAKGPGGQVTRRHSALNEGEELAIVANAIKEQPTMDIAVLCRTNAMAYYFHQGLAAAGLPVVTRERSTMPKDWAMTRAFVEFAANPQNDTLAHFYIIARNTNAGATPASAKQSAHESLRMARANGKSLNAAVLHMIQPDTAAEVLGAAKLYAISKESYMLLTEIVHTQVGPEASPIELALALGNRREHVREDKDRTGIHCITIHAAKGREFDAVFLAGWEQEIIPGTRADELEESRRLAYVAITRARNFVMVTDCQTRQTPWGTIAAHCPSQFIGEMSR